MRPAESRRAGFSPRGASAPPRAAVCAGPREVFGTGGQRGVDRVPFDIPADLAVLGVIPDEPVEVLLLPERPLSIQKPVGAQRGGSFQEAYEKREFDPGSTKQVNMVGHDHVRIDRAPRVRLDPPQLALNQAGDLRPSEVEGAASACVEKPVHCGKGFARDDMFGGENALRRQTPAGTPGGEDRYFRSVATGQTAAIWARVSDRVARGVVGSQRNCGDEAPRGLAPALRPGQAAGKRR